MSTKDIEEGQIFQSIMYISSSKKLFLGLNCLSFGLKKTISRIKIIQDGQLKEFELWMHLMRVFHFSTKNIIQKKSQWGSCQLNKWINYKKQSTTSITDAAVALKVSVSLDTLKSSC